MLTISPIPAQSPRVSSKSQKPSPQVVRFLERAPGLRYLNLDHVKLPTEALRLLLQALTANVLLEVKAAPHQSFAELTALDIRTWS